MGKILESITDTNQRIKEWIGEHRKDIVIFLLIFLISSLSFGLGYLVNREFNRSPIVIEKCSNFDNN